MAPILKQPATRGERGVIAGLEIRVVGNVEVKVSGGQHILEVQDIEKNRLELGFALSAENEESPVQEKPVQVSGLDPDDKGAVLFERDGKLVEQPKGMIIPSNSATVKLKK